MQVRWDHRRFFLVIRDQKVIKYFIQVICFFAGYPFVGKTYVLKKVVEAIDDLTVVVISPKDYRPKGFEKLSETSQREVNLATWKCTLEVLEKAIQESPIDEVVFYDTSCASFDAMNDYFEMAKKFKHKAIYAFVTATRQTCAKRATAKLSDEVLEKYKMNFKKSVPEFSKLADATVVINNEVEPDLSKLIRLIRRENDRIHQS